MQPMPTKTSNFERVREIAMTLPEVEDSAIHGAPSLKVRGKLLTCPAIHRSAEPNTLAVRIGFEQRAESMAADPEIYCVTDQLRELSDRARATPANSPGRVEGLAGHGAPVRNFEEQEGWIMGPETYRVPADRSLTCAADS
jgi:hypothetical protein